MKPKNEFFVVFLALRNKYKCHLNRRTPAHICQARTETRRKRKRTTMKTTRMRVDLGDDREREKNRIHSIALLRRTEEQRNSHFPFYSKFPHKSKAECFTLWFITKKKKKKLGGGQ